MTSTELCSCKVHCADMPEEQDHPLAVCKGLPDKPKRPLIEVVMVPRNLSAAHRSGPGAARWRP